MSTHVIVKVKFEDDIRKAALPLSEVNTFATMANWIAETFNLDGTSNLMLKYKDEGMFIECASRTWREKVDHFQSFDVHDDRCISDECYLTLLVLDNDLITMTNDDDLHFAFQYHPKLYIHACVSGDATGSRHPSPTKVESVAIIHPSSHEEDRFDPSLNDAMSPQRHNRHQSPSSQSTRERFNSLSMNGMPPQDQQQQQLPPPQSASPQNYGAPQHHHQQLQQQSSFSALPRPPTQQQQQPTFGGMPPPPPHHHEQKQQPYPPQSVTQQQFPPSSMNGMPPQQHQQAYQPQSAPQQQFAPPPSTNGMPPQQQPPSNSAIQQHFAQPPMNGHMPSSQQQQRPQVQQPSYPPQFAPPQNLGPPPVFVPGLSNPFARQQRPVQR